MEEIEHDLTPLLRTLFMAWTSHAPQGTAQKLWFYMWSLLAFALVFFIVLMLVVLVKQVLLSLRLPRPTFRKLGPRIGAVFQPFRIIAPHFFRVPLIVCIVALFFAAVGHFAYDFYVLLRVGLCFTCAISFVMLREAGLNSWPAVFALLGLLYNPFIPLHLHRSTWIVLNWATLLLFGTICGLVTPATPPHESDSHQPKGKSSQSTSKVDS